MIFLLFILLWFTNQHFSFEETIRMGQTDVRDFLTLATGPVSAWQNIPLFRAQRFLVPAFIQGINRGTGIAVEALFTLGVTASAVATLWVTLRILRNLNVAQTTRTVAACLVIFNPYLFRYYFAHPGMLTDSVFILGTSVLLWGLVEGKFPQLFLGAVLAVISRQTALLLIFPAVLWIAAGPAWSSFSTSRKLFGILGVVGIVLGGYGATAWFVSGSPLGLLNFTQFAPGLKRFPVFSEGGLLAVYFARAVLPFLFTLLIGTGFFFRQRKIVKMKPEFFLCLVFFVSIQIQTLMIALYPDVGSPIRYAVQGFVPFVLGWGMLLEAMGFGEIKLNRGHFLLCLLIFLGSFHHQTSALYAFRWSNVQFGWAHVLLAGAALIQTSRFRPPRFS